MEENTYIRPVTVQLLGSIANLHHRNESGHSGGRLEV